MAPSWADVAGMGVHQPRLTPGSPTSTQLAHTLAMYRACAAEGLWVRVQLETREGEEEITICCRNCPTAANFSWGGPTTHQRGRKRHVNKKRREKNRRRYEAWISGRGNAPSANLTAAGTTSPVLAAAATGAAATGAAATVASALGSAATGAAATVASALGAAAAGAAVTGATATEAAVTGVAASGAAATVASAIGAAATGAAVMGAATIGAAATGAAATGAAATQGVAMGAAATGAAAPPTKRHKSVLVASRASIRSAVVSKRKDGCLVGSSMQESPEKERGSEKLNNSLVIEFEDDELQRGETGEAAPGTAAPSSTTSLSPPDAPNSKKHPMGFLPTHPDKFLCSRCHLRCHRIKDFQCRKCDKQYGKINKRPGGAALHVVYM